MNDEDNVLKTIAESQNFFGGNDPMCINIVNISKLLNFTKYKVKKNINTLKKKGLIKLVCVKIYDEYENIPPIWGYVPTEKAKNENEIVKKNNYEYEKSLKGLSEMYNK